MPRMQGKPGNIWASVKQRGENQIFDLVNAGAPTNGTSGTGVEFAGPGSTYFDTTNRVMYYNVGTKASPFWQALTTGVGFFHRRRNTTAEINAGVSLLAAITGYAYRLCDAALIAIGGNAATATTVDILGTRSAGSVKLLAGAIANLTQSALLRAGATGGTILADGASFTVLDANTPITAGKTGSNLATATHIDSLLWYQIEKA